MSDFLTHLASRAVAPVPIVRPLVRSTYEPRAVDEFKLPETVSAPAIRDFQTLPIAQPGGLPSPGPGRKIIDHKDAPRPPQPVSPAPARVHESPPTIALAPVQVVAGLEPLGEISPQPLAVKAVPVVTPRIEAKSIAQSAIGPMESVAPRSADQKTPVTPNITIRAATPPEQRQPDAASLQSLRPSVQKAPHVTPRPSRAGHAAATPQPAPQVTITIGRVEIRAAAPAVQPPSPAANSGPRLSLETYLRRSANKSA